MGDGWNSMPDQPRNCGVCGAQVTMKRGAWFRTGPGAPETFCHPCTPKWRLERA